MSDDFLSDVAGAVDNGGTLAPESAAPATPEPVAEPASVRPNTVDVDARQRVENDMNKMFEDNDPHKEPEVVTKSKEADEAKAEAKVEAAEEKPEQKQRSRSQRGGYLDKFLKEDEHGNLLNDDGDVIATAGTSRNFYEGVKKEARKFRSAATELALSHKELAQQFKALYDEHQDVIKNGADPIQSIVKETGFSTHEGKEALALLRQYKKDPIGAIKGMLTQAKMSGIDVSQIGANIAVDPSMLRSTFETMIDEKLGKKDTVNPDQQAYETAAQEAASFLEKHPKARKFAKQIGEAKIRYPDMSLERIWYNIVGAAKSAREKAQSQQRQNSTKHRKEPPRKTQQAPVRQYSTMNFQDIAASIKEDFGST